ncbi:MAG: TonB-dependent receptor [Acidobacteria bacterium]|nr:TonB-dependent receptor [Acidobacteriota bacterium]
MPQTFLKPSLTSAIASVVFGLNLAAAALAQMPLQHRILPRSFALGATVSISLITGTISDISGAPIPSATITLSNADGILRSATTSPTGTFTLLDIPTGVYLLKAAAAGFSPYANPNTIVAVGRNLQLSIVMRPAGAKEALTVTAQGTGLDTSQTSSVTNIDKDRIEELPIESRNYLVFSLLAPQVAQANPAIAQQTLTQGTGGFSFGGLRANSNALYIDGVDDDDEYTGSSRTELSPEAISDFQIVNHGFQAQSGGAAGGSIDVQTRAGMRLQHGDAFIFVQDGALNADPPLEILPYKPDEIRLRTGLSTGGPLFTNKTFYYIAAEQEYARGEDANDLSAATIAQINRSIATIGPLPSLSLQPGFFPTTEQETEFSARLDHTFDANNTLMLRYALTNNRDVNDAFNIDDLSDRSARGSAFHDDNSLNGTLSSILSSGLVNSLSFELSQRRAVDRTLSTTAPGVLIPGIAQFGTPFAGNDRRFETHAEFSESIVQQRGKHLFQAGISLDHIALRSHDLDGFRGLYIFRDLTALSTGDADFYTQSFGNPDTNLAEIRSAAYAQDHWTPSSRLAIDYGIRYDDNHLPGPLPQHPVNISPRLGLAYTPNSSWVIRTGFGMFYDRYDLSTINRILEFNGTSALSQTEEGPAAAALYRSGAQFTSPQLHIAPNIWTAQHHLANPYSEVASLGVERSLPQGFTAKAEYQFVHGVRLGRTINANLLPPVILTPQNATALDIDSPTPQQLNRLIFTPERINPTYNAINQFQTEANSNYNGTTLTLNRQFDEQFELMAGYTFSKTIDDASYDSEQPQNPYDLARERALSLQDQRNRFILSGLWVLGPDLDDPQDQAQGPSTSPIMRALTGLEFAPIFAATSGFRANPVTGQDTNHENIYPFAARPLGYGRNALQTSPNIDLDLRVLKMVPLWCGHLDIVAESFNLLNHTNVSLLNTAYGTGTSPLPSFGAPIAASTARRIQFSLDFEY